MSDKQKIYYYQEPHFACSYLMAVYTSQAISSALFPIIPSLKHTLLFAAGLVIFSSFFYQLLLISIPAKEAALDRQLEKITTPPGVYGLLKKWLFGLITYKKWDLVINQVDRKNLRPTAKQKLLMILVELIVGLITILLMTYLEFSLLRVGFSCYMGLAVYLILGNCLLVAIIFSLCKLFNFYR